MIVKSKQTSNYTVVPNEVFKDLNDFLAIGILTYLLSNRHDWVVYKKTLYEQFTQGRKAIDKAFTLLEQKGYLMGAQKMDATGKFIGYEWIVYDTPQLDLNRMSQKEQPVVPYEQPDVLLPIVDKEQLTNTIPNKEEITNKKPTVKKNKALPPPTIEELTEYFTNNGYSKESAQKAFNYYQASLTNGGKVWRDGRGNVVKNWKQKMQSVWFKDEHKIKNQTTGNLPPGKFYDHNGNIIDGF